MHYGAMLVGQFIKAAEFGSGDTPKQPTWTIARVVIEKLESVAMNDMEGSSSKIKSKGVIYFREIERGWVINRTNAECLAAMWGVDTDVWVNKRVTLYAADVRVGAKMDIGIRVKGSPDITREVNVSVKLPRRKPVNMKMVPTGNALPPPDFTACATVDALKQAWTDLGRDDDAAKAAYKARLAALRSAVPPPPDEE